MAQGQTNTVDAPDTLPADFFDKKKAAATDDAPDTLPADFFDKKDQPAGRASASSSKEYVPEEKTDFEKKREGGGGYLSGLRSSLPSLGSIARRAAFGGFDPSSDIDSLKDLYHNTGDRLKRGWQAGKITSGVTGVPQPITSALTAGAYAVAPLVGVNPQSIEQRADAGDTAGIAGELTIPTVAGLAPVATHLAAKATPHIGRAVRTETGELRPIAGAAAEGIGTLAGGVGGHFVGEPIAGAIAGRKFGRVVADKLLPRNPEEAATAQRAAEETEAGNINRATQIQDVHNRRIEREKAAAEREATRKGAKTLSIPNAATSASPAGAAPPMPEPGASSIASTNPKVADMSALTAKRGKVAGPEEAEPPIEEGTIPVIGAPKPGGKGGKGGAGAANAPEAQKSGSEGTAARWTNEYVMEQAKRGDRTAIEQAARRGLQLPPNARYVMGDVDIPRVVLNPKEVTRFTPEGTPIRDMSRPETSSRERIQPAGGETIPPVEPLFQTPSMKVPSDTVRAGIHMDPINPPAARVEGVLPSMEGDVARQAEGAAKVKGEDLTRQANTPKDINQAAGEMETKSPLFRGTAASPQKEIFAPGGEPSATHAGEPPTAEELSPEHVELPKLKEAFTAAEADRQYVADEFHQGRATYKELQDAQKAAEKAKDAVDEAEGTNEQMRQLHERLAKEAERNNPERIDAARDLVFDTINKLKNMERGGPSFSEYNADTRPTAAGREKGDFYGGKVGSIPSGRATIPWLQNRPKWGWSKLEAAMMSGKSKLYNEVVRAADEYLQGQTPEGKAANAATADRVVASTSTSGPAKFANFQKPTKLEPPAAEPPETRPPAEAAPSAGLPKTARFSKSQWDRFTPDRKNAEYALAKRRGQTIDIYTKK